MVRTALIALIALMVDASLLLVPLLLVLLLLFFDLFFFCFFFFVVFVVLDVLLFFVSPDEASLRDRFKVDLSVLAIFVPPLLWSLVNVISCCGAPSRIFCAVFVCNKVRGWRR